MTDIRKIRDQVRRDLKSLFDNLSQPMTCETSFKHPDGRTEVVWFDGRRFEHDLAGYRFTAMMIGGRA